MKRHIALINNAVRERERRKRASSLIQVAHEDTVEQKAEEHKENEEGKRAQLKVPVLSLAHKGVTGHRGVDSRAETSREQLQPFKPQWLGANGFPQDSVAGMKVLFTSMTSRRLNDMHPSLDKQHKATVTTTYEHSLTFDLVMVLGRRSASSVRTDWLRGFTGGWLVLSCIKAGAVAAALHTSKPLLLHHHHLHLLLHTAALTDGSSPGWWSLRERHNTDVYSGILAVHVALMSR
ncbi:hypothetical protein INR49_023757 [Caranx melampygus]|nr:hypothetical protein INR49_023757 [Caranx melampygus]